MGKNVIVIASGRTKQVALPHLLAHLEEENITVSEIRYPQQNRDIGVDTATNLVRAIWFEKRYTDPPGKFVILVDVDGKRPDEVVRPLREEVPRRLQSHISVPVLFAFAQQHLEAWFFADSRNLREYLSGRNLRNIDTSKPDGIDDPKRHLQNLLGNVIYTSQISGQIARSLHAPTVAGRSPSFDNFLSTVRNGVA